MTFHQAFIWNWLKSEGGNLWGREAPDARLLSLILLLLDGGGDHATQWALSVQPLFSSPCSPPIYHSPKHPSIHNLVAFYLVFSILHMLYFPCWFVRGVTVTYDGSWFRFQGDVRPLPPVTYQIFSIYLPWQLLFHPYENHTLTKKPSIIWDLSHLVFILPFNITERIVWSLLPDVKHFWPLDPACSEILPERQNSNNWTNKVLKESFWTKLTIATWLYRPPGPPRIPIPGTRRLADLRDKIVFLYFIVSSPFSPWHLMDPWRWIHGEKWLVPFESSCPGSERPMSRGSCPPSFLPGQWTLVWLCWTLYKRVGRPHLIQRGAVYSVNSLVFNIAHDVLEPWESFVVEIQI